MKEKVAVATIDGKAYFLIVNKIRERNITFLSLIPGDPVSSEVKVVITTEKETHLIEHQKKLVFTNEQELDILVSQVEKILQGKEEYKKVIVGIDPGEAIGLAVIADGKVIEESNCFTTKELIDAINKTTRTINFSVTNVLVKIGNGVTIYKDLIEALDEALLPKIKLEVVNEAGTNRPLKENKRSRRVRHISSAKRIAGRIGYFFVRRKTIATNS